MESPSSLLLYPQKFTQGSIPNNMSTGLLKFPDTLTPYYHLFMKSDKDFSKGELIEKIKTITQNFLKVQQKQFASDHRPLSNLSKHYQTWGYPCRAGLFFIQEFRNIVLELEMRGLSDSNLKDKYEQFIESFVDHYYEHNPSTVEKLKTIYQEFLSILTNKCEDEAKAQKIKDLDFFFRKFIDQCFAFFIPMGNLVGELAIFSQCFVQHSIYLEIYKKMYSTLLFSISEGFDIVEKKLKQYENISFSQLTFVEESLATLKQIRNIYFEDLKKLEFRSFKDSSLKKYQIFQEFFLAFRLFLNEASDCKDKDLLAEVKRKVHFGRESIKERALLLENNILLLCQEDLKFYYDLQLCFRLLGFFVGDSLDTSKPLVKYLFYKCNSYSNEMKDECDRELLQPSCAATSDIKLMTALISDSKQAKVIPPVGKKVEVAPQRITRRKKKLPIIASGPVPEDKRNLKDLVRSIKSGSSRIGDKPSRRRKTRRKRSRHSLQSSDKTQVGKNAENIIEQQKELSKSYPALDKYCKPSDYLNNAFIFFIMKFKEIALSKSNDKELERKYNQFLGSFVDLFSGEEDSELREVFTEFADEIKNKFGEEYDSLIKIFEDLINSPHLFKYSIAFLAKGEEYKKYESYYLGLTECYQESISLLKETLNDEIKAILNILDVYKFDQTHRNLICQITDSISTFHKKYIAVLESLQVVSIDQFTSNDYHNFKEFSNAWNQLIGKNSAEADKMNLQQDSEFLSLSKGISLLNEHPLTKPEEFLYRDLVRCKNQLSFIVGSRISALESFIKIKT